MVKVRAFKKVVDVVMEEKLEQDSNYVEMITLIGLDRMLQDTLPKEEPIALKTMTVMFSRNPQFIADFVAEMIESGRSAKPDWASYVI